MNNQELINILIGFLGAVFGYILNQVWTSVKELQNADRDLTEKLTAVEILVAGNYVNKSDFSALSDALFKKLDKIEDKLDKKLDK